MIYKTSICAYSVQFRFDHVLIQRDLIAMYCVELKLKVKGTDALSGPKQSHMKKSPVFS